MEVFNFLKNRNWESKYEETIQPARTVNSDSCPDFGSSSYADFQDTVPKYQLRPDRLLRYGFKLAYSMRLFEAYGLRAVHFCFSGPYNFVGPLCFPETV